MSADVRTVIRRDLSRKIKGAVGGVQSLRDQLSTVSYVGAGLWNWFLRRDGKALKERSLTYAEALKQAQDEVEELLRSGHSEIFEAASGPDGVVDKNKLIFAALRATKKLALKILEGSH